METGTNNKITQVICSILMVLVLTSATFAYPPDNAALLYYRASLAYDASDTMMDKVNKVIKSNADIDDEIRQYMEDNKYAIKYFVDAGNAPSCDWGMDYSEGIALLMPHFSSLRNLGRIVCVQAEIKAESGDYNRALELCLSVNKEGNHIAGGGLLISHLVGISLNAMANQYIVDILPQISDNPEALLKLREQIYDVSGKFPSIKGSISRDLGTCMQDIRKEKAGYIADTLLVDQISKEKARIIRRGDENFFKANKEYFLNHQAAVLTAIDLPYRQSFEQLKRLDKKLKEDYKKDPHSILTNNFLAAIDRILSLNVRIITHFNALKTAIEIYMIEARTGKLPDALPDGLPGDLFSGKDFKYKKTAEGFTLRCQGKDLSKDEIYKYEFKVK
ncbi:MAG: hypothetical protein ACYS6K_06865 [Planctomycetota bacterium]|jgi:hypothetical protein